MYKISYKPSPIEGRVRIDAPYNRAFKDRLKEVVPSATWVGGMWEYDEEAQPLVTELVNAFYVHVTWKRIEFDFGSRGGNPEIDGASLARVQRDYFRWQSDIALKVVESDIESGGSRRYPALFGRVVLDVLIRDGAEISPEPISISDALEVYRPDPLAGVSAGQMLKAMHGRETELADFMRQQGWFVFAPTRNENDELDEIKRLLPHILDAERLLAMAAMYVKQALPERFAYYVNLWHGLVNRE